MFRVWWVFVHDFVTNFLLFPTESNSERILKIGQYLVKLWARVRCLVFFDSRCRMTRTDKRIDIQTDAVPWQTLLRVLCGQRQYATDLSYRSGMAQTATAIYSTPTILANHYSSCSTSNSLWAKQLPTRSAECTRTSSQLAKLPMRRRCVSCGKK